MTMKFILGAAFAFGLATSADAALLAPPVTSNSDSAIVKVYGGCGPYGHRGPYGGCRPGGQWGGYRWGRPCPPGFHLGRYGHRCWPN
ncbi:MAG TPA: hypothetical protein VKV96_07845 [Roseiarcus sp.]|nr:hypothetical protein [Roseiarcus sp.]